MFFRHVATDGYNNRMTQLEVSLRAIAEESDEGTLAPLAVLLFETQSATSQGGS